MLSVPRRFSTPTMNVSSSALLHPPQWLSSPQLLCVFLSLTFCTSTSFYPLLIHHPLTSLFTPLTNHLFLCLFLPSFTAWLFLCFSVPPSHCSHWLSVPLLFFVAFLLLSLKSVPQFLSAFCHTAFLCPPPPCPLPQRVSSSAFLYVGVRKRHSWTTPDSRTRTRTTHAADMLSSVLILNRPITIREILSWASTLTISKLVSLLAKIFMRLTFVLKVSRAWDSHIAFEKKYGVIQ